MFQVVEQTTRWTRGGAVRSRPYFGVSYSIVFSFRDFVLAMTQAGSEQRSYVLCAFVSRIGFLPSLFGLLWTEIETDFGWLRGGRTQ
jgi:hypothetical protein